MLLLYIPTRISPASLALLQSAGWTLRPVERIAPPPSRMPGDIFRDQYTKLRLYELEYVFAPSRNSDVRSVWVLMLRSQRRMRLGLLHGRRYARRAPLPRGLGSRGAIRSRTRCAHA